MIAGQLLLLAVRTICDKNLSSWKNNNKDRTSILAVQPLKGSAG